MFVNRLTEYLGELLEPCQGAQLVHECKEGVFSCQELCQALCIVPPEWQGTQDLIWREVFRARPSEMDMLFVALYARPPYSRQALLFLSDMLRQAGYPVDRLNFGFMGDPVNKSDNIT